MSVIEWSSMDLNQRGVHVPDQETDTLLHFVTHTLDGWTPTVSAFRNPHKRHGGGR